MDTVRADRVGGFGGAGTTWADADTTPVLRGIAERGARFTRFYAASNYTLPSHMSIFTGLDPVEHGVTDGFARLSSAVPTLAERLAGAGYRTQAFHEGGYVDERFGFGRGFEEYHELPRVELVRSALPEVLAWLRARGEEPYFLFLHTYAAHFPYGGYERTRRERPERGLLSDEEIASLRAAYPDTAEARRRAEAALAPERRVLCTLYNQLAPPGAGLLGCGRKLPTSHFVRSPRFGADLAVIRESYDARIALVDAAIGRIRDALVALGQWDDTLLVVTSDHGEAFYEHRLYQHDLVPFEEVLRVPLVVSYPRLLGAGGPRVVDAPAWHPDLFATLLSLAGVESPAGPEAVDLVPALRGAAMPARLLFPAVLRLAHYRQQPALRVAIDGGLKYIEGHAAFGDRRGLLFDLAEDPAERTNLRGARPERFRELAERARAYADGRRIRPPERQSPLEALEAVHGAPGLAPEDAEKLRALGYALEAEAEEPAAESGRE